jgi:hypothetical protein
MQKNIIKLSEKNQIISDRIPSDNVGYGRIITKQTVTDR